VCGLIPYLVQFFSSGIYNCVTFQFQELGKQRSSDDEEDNMFDCLTTELECRLEAGSTIRKELIDIRKNKSDSHQLDGYGPVEQNAVVPSATMLNNVLVTGSAAGSATEIDCVVCTKQNTSASKVTSCTVTARPSSSTTVTASEHSFCNVTAASKQFDSSFVPVITTNQNTTATSEQIGLTSGHTSITPTSSADESHITVTPASEAFMRLTKRSETENANITADHLKASSKVGTYSLKDKSDTTSKPVNTSHNITDGKQSSPMACINEYSGSSDESQNCGHINLQKVESNTLFSDIAAKELWISNCDTEAEFYKSVELALIAVLKKEVGESISQIMAAPAMAFFEIELNSMMQEVMTKALSYVLDNVIEWKKQAQDSQCKVAALISRIVQEWKEEFMLVRRGQRVESGKETPTVGDRLQKYKERMSELYCNIMAPNESNWKEDNNGCSSRNSIDDVGNDCNNGTEGKDALLGSVTSHDVTDCKLKGMPRNVSDQGTQTVSTGCILYLKCVHD
jgi:hypothetical protein